MFSDAGQGLNMELPLVFDTALSSGQAHVILNHRGEPFSTLEWISQDRLALLVSGDIDAWKKVVAEIPDDDEQCYVLDELFQRFPKLRAHIRV